MAQAATTVPSQERGVNRWVGIGAVVFAALAAVLLFVALQSRDGGGRSAVSTVDVVVASQAVSANTTLTADMLTVESIPADSLLDGAYAETGNVIGLPLRYPVQAGQQITSASVGVQQIEDENDLALVLPAGKRAVAVEVSEQTSVGGLLLPGNFVDLIVVIDGGGESLSDNRALTILQNIEVLSVAQEAQEPVPGAGTDESTTDGEATTGEGVTGERPEDVERQPDAATVTLAVTPQEAQLLALLQADTGDQGLEIMLALRATGDQNVDGVPPFFPPADLIVPSAQ